MRVLVCTVVHNPTDARIFRRQIGSLLDAGHEVTAIAPWSKETPGDERIKRIAIPRARGRNRFAALRAARARMRDLAFTHDVVVLHDPELLIVTPWWDFSRWSVSVVWDVHEDLAAAITTKAYLPSPTRRALAFLARRLERWAERKCTLLLAETAYQNRFGRKHPVVLNLPLVPPQLEDAPCKRQAIYVGSITTERGLDAMIKLAAALAPHDINLRIIGEVHSDRDREVLRQAENIEWDGPLPNAQAMQEVQHSMVGLSLLANKPNYQHSMPTKVLEYMACGTVVVSTPLPLAVEVIANDGIVLSGFGESIVSEAAKAIVELCNNSELRENMIQRAFVRVERDYNWLKAGPEFVRLIEDASYKRS
jgi:glycosyltransferase involved in cell wall biosynthesis